ncbi:hypothetical protein [Neisseria sp. 74A18]|uniref:hypothetical protein n=1 Tax=Neisseria sp. 74A18 TaxID=1696094 RepID=UPI0006CACBE7|nr:hypothetical protein [Neisseria sp. 74A18]KPN74077.1 hypothetical protein AKG43_04625 [Neisseria sp. 74A18]
MSRIWIILMFILFSNSKLFAMSSPLLPDGVVNIILKNGNPCFFLNNEKKIKSLTIIKSNMVKAQEIIIPDNQTVGYNMRNCVEYNQDEISVLQDNTIYSGFIHSNFNNKPHSFLFCIKKNKHSSRIVSIEKIRDSKGSNTGKIKCSDKDWKPQKYYGGIFGWLEKLKDSIFNKDIIEYK